MNSIYRSIWNDSTSTFVAVPENARSAGKKTSSGSFAKGASSCFALKALAVSVMLAFGASNYAAPTGGAVTAGSASITNGPGSTVITQASQNVAINWKSFNIGLGEAVQFVQPNSNSVALNRVLGSDPSSILGSLSANGKVFLLNPNGILFGKGASVNVGGLVASSLNLTDSDFMAGNYKFAGAGSGAVVNQGSINADGGYVALLGANVANNGVITAKLGSVALAAGNAITLDVVGDGLLNVMVNQGAVNALVQNGGLIRADGGQVLLTAQAAGNLLQSVVNNTGVIQAQTLQNHNGTIRLLGDMQSGTVNVGGTLDVSGTGAEQTGGSVTTTGHHVGLFGGHINASGDAGGGTVLVGGDYQGKNPAVQNAQATYVSPDASVKADAITSGNGGKVIVWADDFTRFQGNISARGGAQSGNGGIVETSGHINLEVLGGSVDAGAPLGKAGTWLLDPSNVDITTSATANGALDGLSPTNTFVPTSNTAVVNAGDISLALANTNVNITTDSTGTQAGTITVSAPITRSAGTGTTTLTLTPNQVTGGTITIASGGGISGSIGHPLNVSLAAAGVGANVAVGAPITTFGGNFTSTGTTFTNLDGSITTAGGRIDINQTTGAATVTIAAPLASGDGNIVIAGGSTFTATSTIDAGTGTVTLQGSADTVAIGVGSTTGTFNITQAAIAGITTTGGLIIGRSSGTAAIHIGTLEVVDFGTKNVTIQQASGGMTVEGATVSGAITGSGSTTFNAGTGFFINNQVINTSGAVNISADQVTINANIAGAGKLTIAPFTAATAIQVGVAPTRIDFGASNFITNSISSKTRTLQIGDTSNTGGITVTGAFNPGFSTLNLVTGGAIDIPVVANTITATNVVLAGSSFNNAGAATIATPGGRWLVYSTNPSSDVKGGLAYNFKQYNLAYPGTPATATGNGFIYSVAPMITPSLITGATAVSKTYNGTAAASLASDNYATSGALDGDTVLLNNPTSGLYNDKNVGTGKSVTASGLSIASATNGTATVYGYQLAGTSASGNIGTITKAPLGVTAVFATKTYDGLLTAAGTGTVGAIAGAGDVVNSAGSQAYTDKNYGTADKTVQASGVTIKDAGNADMTGNYTISYTDNTASTITKAPLGVTAVFATKTYDGLLTAAGTGTVGAIAGAGDVVNSAGSQAFLDKNAGIANKTVRASGVTIKDAGAVDVSSNYNITYTDNLISTITPYAVSFTGTKVYDTNANFAFGSFGTAGTITGLGTETLLLGGTGTVPLTGVAAGSQAVTLGSLALNNGTGTALNYTFTGGTQTANIIPTALDITANAAAKTYDGLVFSGGNGVVYSGFVNSETSSVLDGALVYGGTSQGAINVGNYAITPSGQSSTNYTISYVNGTLGVTPTALDITANSTSKAYGSTVIFSGNEFSSTGLKNGETVTSVTETSPGQVATATVLGSPYVITPSDATGGTFTPSNYAIGYANGVLTVIPLVPPPVVVPPVDLPPVDLPPVDLPPVDLPPVDLPPPVEPPSVVAIPVMPPMDESHEMPLVKPRVVMPTWMPVVAPIKIPPQLLTLGPPVTPPAVLFVAPDETPVAVPEKTSIMVLAQTPPQVYVAPHRPRKQDRN